MQTQRNHRLFDLSVRNSQRRNLEVLSTVSALQALLAAASPVFHPDTPTSVPSAVARAMRLHSEAAPEPGVETTQTSSAAKAKRWLEDALRQMPDEPCYLGFGRSVAQAFESSPVWATKYPVLLTNPRAITQSLHGVLELAEDFIVVVSKSGDAGLVIDTYGGYLPEEPSADEVVYELTVWRGDA